MGEEGENFWVGVVEGFGGGVVGGGFEEGDVEDDVGEVGVEVMAVGEPVVGMEMNFDIADKELIINENLGFFEVGAFELVPVAWVEDLEGFLGECFEFIVEEVLVEPDFLEDAFWDGDGALEALDEFFVGGEMGGRVSHGFCCFHNFCDLF